MTDGSGSVRANVRAAFAVTLAASAVQFLFLMLLARLLSPADYGRYAICLAVASLSALLVTNSAERALVLSGDDRQSDTTAEIVLLCGIAAAFALIACAALNFSGLAAIDLGLLALVLAGGIVAGLGVAPRVELRRKMRFGPILAAETAGLVAGAGIVAAALAWGGLGAYALAGGAVAQSALIVVLLLVLGPSGARPRLRLPAIGRGVALVRAVSGAGANALAEIVNGQVPALVLGARLGAPALGLYNRGYSIVQIPIQLLVASISRVMISALHAVSDDRDRLRSASSRMLRTAGVVVAPVAAGLAGASGNFVTVVLGPAWAEAAGFLPMLALGAWAVMMGALFGIIAESRRGFAAKARAQSASTACLALLALGGSWFGLVGAVAGIALASLVFMLLSARAAAMLLGVPVTRLLRCLVPGMAVAIPCLLAALALDRLPVGPPLMLLAAQIGGCGIAAALALLLQPRLLLELVEAAAPAVLRRLPPVRAYLLRSARTPA